MATLELKNIRKSYGATQVIHGIDLDIPSGDFCVFVGPSGCGKSTLLRMIAGLEDITSGAVCIEGEVVNHISAAKRGLAMVFQSYALYPHMSVKANLSFGLENIGMPRAEIEERVMQAARMLQLDQYLTRKPGQLSGGQRQRVAIGRAVVREPKVFLFDEPLSNLDAELRVAMRGEIGDLHRRLGNTMIYVTHDQVEAMTMADKIAVLRDGKLEQYGPPLDLYNAPANRFVAGFIGSPKMNFLPGEFRSGQVHLKAGSAIDATAFAGAGDVELGVRANHLEITDVSDGALVCEVHSAEQLGGETYIYGALSDDTPITLHRPGQVPVRRGEKIGVRVDASVVHLFSMETGASLAT
ncbi:ABC transporter ATP-binding protein [Primorskyibacter sp. S187A]|uniref:ABC transporter ATP-binding protein n=1 Tax=Primorskyibacter sp. S187A TaxID=3415130 RepID=UPI003C7B4DC7